MHNRLIEYILRVEVNVKGLIKLSSTGDIYLDLILLLLLLFNFEIDNK